MLEDPEFEPEFYQKQIDMMEQRYAKLFKKWHLSWTAYYGYVIEKLKAKQYWIWVFLCGFEKFVQEQGEIGAKRRSRLYKDADERIRRIIGDYNQIQDYVKHL